MDPGVIERMFEKEWLKTRGRPVFSSLEPDVRGMVLLKETWSKSGANRQVREKGRGESRHSKVS